VRCSCDVRSASAGRKPPTSPATAISPDGKNGYVAIDVAFFVQVLFIGAVEGPIVVGNEPSGVAFAPDSKRAYVTNSSDGTVSVIATATGTVVATLPVGANPEGVAVSPDGKQVYVANSGSNTVSVIDSRTNRVAATIPAGNGPAPIEVPIMRYHPLRSEAPSCG
jgi:YVTN family beta-propeller protein